MSGPAVTGPARFSRRVLLGRAAAGGAAVAGTGALGALGAVGGAAFAPPGVAAAAGGLDDATILRLSVQLEQVAQLACEMAVASGLLDARRRASVAAIGAQERQHADAFGTFLHVNLGGALPPPPRGSAAVDAVVPGLSRARSQHELLSLLAELERVSIYSYYLGAQSLYDQKLVQTATAVLGDHSQHLVVLRQALGRDPLPAAIEVGAARGAAGVR